MAPNIQTPFAVKQGWGQAGHAYAIVKSLYGSDATCAYKPVLSGFSVSWP